MDDFWRISEAGSFSDFKDKLASSPSQPIQSNENQIEVNIKVVITRQSH